MNHSELTEALGPVDIYLFDQIMKGRFNPSMRILDVGCGNGRNLVWFFRNGFQVFGADASENAIESLRTEAARLAPDLPADNFVVAPADKLPFPNNNFDAVLAIALLHFARGRNHFDAMLDELWRTLAPGGILFTRLASSIGIERLIAPAGDETWRLPDGSERFLVDEALLLESTDRLNARFVEPIKTVNVHNQRCMTTWILRKPPAKS